MPLTIGEDETPNAAELLARLVNNLSPGALHVMPPEAAVDEAIRQLGVLHAEVEGLRQNAGVEAAYYKRQLATVRERERRGLEREREQFEDEKRQFRDSCRDKEAGRLAAKDVAVLTVAARLRVSHSAIRAAINVLEPYPYRVEVTEALRVLREGLGV